MYYTAFAGLVIKFTGKFLALSAPAVLRLRASATLSPPLRAFDANTLVQNNAVILSLQFYYVFTTVGIFPCLRQSDVEDRDTKATQKDKGAKKIL